MKRLLGITALALTLSLVLAGCASKQSLPPDSQNGVDQGAAGLRLAPGLYDLEDGTVQAVGTLVWQDLEGGFWAVTGGTEAEGNAGETVAVLANGGDFEGQLRPLEGKTVTVTGTRLEGASIRMAGPEIEMQSIQELSDTPGIAE